MRFCGAFSLRAALRPGRAAGGARRGARERRRRPPRGRRRRPPCARRDPPRGAPRSASSSAPPDVTTSSTRQTHSPSSKAPSMRFAGAVLLRLLADDEERKAGLQRGSGGERDGAELRRGEPRRVGRVLRDGRGDPLAERREQVGTRLEAELVEVVPRALARAEQEVALEVGGLDERRASSSSFTRASAASTRAPAGAAAGLGRAAHESHEGAVVEVDVDPRPPAAPARDARRAAAPPPASPSSASSLRTHRPPSSSAAGFGFGAGCSASEASAELEIEEDEARRRLAAWRPRRRRARPPPRARRRRCRRASSARICVAARRRCGTRRRRVEQPAPRDRAAWSPARSANSGRAEQPPPREDGGRLDVRRQLEEVGERLGRVHRGER